MTNATTRVIRSDEVKMAGRRQIGSAAAPAPQPGQAQPVRAGQPTARIVAEDAAGATIEVVCECGKRTYVRCAYRGANQIPQGRPQPAEMQLQEAAT